jgi:hypothetical protein
MWGSLHCVSRSHPRLARGYSVSLLKTNVAVQKQLNLLPSKEEQAAVQALPVEYLESKVWLDREVEPTPGEFTRPGSYAPVELDDGSVLLTHRRITSFSSKEELPPPIVRGTRRYYMDADGSPKIPPRLSDAQRKEIRELRASDPDTWTARRLATKFGVPPYTILKIAQAPVEKKQEDLRRRLFEEANMHAVQYRVRTNRKELLAT